MKRTIMTEPKHMFGENIAIHPWADEDVSASVRVWAFDDGKVWACLDSHGVSLTFYGVTADMRTLAAKLVAAADASDAGLAARAKEGA